MKSESEEAFDEWYIHTCHLEHNGKTDYKCGWDACLEWLAKDYGLILRRHAEPKVGDRYYEPISYHDGEWHEINKEPSKSRDFYNYPIVRTIEGLCKDKRNN